MSSNRYYHLLLANFVFLLTRYEKSYSLASVDSTPSSSSSFLYEGLANITLETSDEQRLFYKIMTGYEKAVRPLKNSSEAVVVKLGLTLTQILDVVSDKKFNRLSNFYVCYRMNEIK